MTAFEQAWSLLKARPEEQLMGMGGTYSGGMTIDPNVLAMAGGRKGVERAPFTSDQGLTREQLQAEAARMRAEGMSDELIAQRQAQAMLADPSVAGRGLRETELAEGFQSPGERRADVAGLTGAARRQLGGGQRGLRMDTSSMTPGQRQNVVDKETGELGMRRKVRVRRGNEEGIMTMGRGRGRKGAFKQRSFEALGANPDKREFKTPEQRQIDRDRAMAERLGIAFEEPEESKLVREPRKFKEGFKPGSDAYEARHQQLEDQEELLHQMYSQPVIDPNTGKLVPNPHLGMAERIMQEITENPEPPTFTPRASMQGADQFQGDRPVYRPSTGQFLGPQFDEMGQPKMTSRGAPSMTGISPVDIEQMGRDAMVDGEIDPRILQEYYDKLDAAPVTADEKRAVRARQSAEDAGMAYLRERGLPTTSSTPAKPVFRTDIDRLKDRRTELEEKARKQRTGYGL